MFLYDFSAAEFMQYYYTGKFEAPSPHWKHEEFPLTEFELFVMTEGTLYLSYDKEDFTVENGEFLLLAPSDNLAARRRGFRSAFCSFYWLHFLPPKEPGRTEIPDSACLPCSPPPPNFRQYLLYPTKGKNP